MLIGQRNILHKNQLSVLNISRENDVALAALKKHGRFVSNTFFRHIEQCKRKSSGPLLEKTMKIMSVNDDFLQNINLKD